MGLLITTNDPFAAPTKPKANVLAASSRTDQAEIEKQKLTLEKAKFDRDTLEKAKLDPETQKDALDFELESRKASLTALSIALPLMGGLLAYGFQIWAQGRNESLQFKLKAAEIALNARDSNQVQAKAVILKALFEEELRTFDPHGQFDPKHHAFSRSVEA